MSRIPRCTYRVQLHAGFTFDDAAAIVPYLERLGVSHLYTSPIFAANPGSMHGYDVENYGVINPELGGDEGFRRLRDALDRHGLRLLVDFVPNHMGIAAGRNSWWQDVLENGPWSRFAGYFDIEWASAKTELAGKVLLPVLGDHYGVVLERGDLYLERDGPQLSLRYFENVYPVDPASYPSVLRAAIQKLAAVRLPDDLGLLEIQSISAAFARLPAEEDVSADAIEARSREVVVSKHRLGTLLTDDADLADALKAAVAELNGRAGDPQSFDALDQLLEAQHYRLAFWRVAAEEINYRRFFAINELAGVRQENQDVFRDSHARLLELIESGAIDGVRIDHPDGLLDPAGYVAALRDAAATDEPLYLVLEKILEPDELLPADWQVDGTVGYEFARVCTGIFVDERHRRRFDETYARFSGAQPEFDDIVYESKRLILRLALASELNVLARVLDRITEGSRTTRDFTLNSLRVLLRETIACFPVYRTYTTCDGSLPTPAEMAAIDTAIARAGRRNPDIDPSLFAFLRHVLTLERDERCSDELHAEMCRFTMKFQQLTGPVMAKGLEDTAFYRYNRLLALNEVGGDPATFGTSPEGFHVAAKSRVASGDHGLLASSTHDTKRSEDVRARMAALADLPSEWRTHTRRWQRAHKGYKTRVDGWHAPDGNDEYALYQAIIGAWPSRLTADLTDRVVDYMIKAVREAQVHSSWTAPNVDYESATEAFTRAVLDPETNPAFADIESFATRVAVLGGFNSLSMQLLKLTQPGVPDIYQGTEVIDLSLVDPDNRRPVDFDRNREFAARDVGDGLTVADSEALDFDRLKFGLTFRALTVRKQLPSLFERGGYEAGRPVDAHARHVVAFHRRDGEHAAIVAVPRLVGGLVEMGRAPIGPGVWGETSVRFRNLPGGTYADAFSGRTFELRPRGNRVELLAAELFERFPAALLVRSPNGPDASESRSAAR